MGQQMAIGVEYPLKEDLLGEIGGTYLGELPRDIREYCLQPYLGNLEAYGTRLIHPILEKTISLGIIYARGEYVMDRLGRVIYLDSDRNDLIFRRDLRTGERIILRDGTESTKERYTLYRYDEATDHLQIGVSHQGQHRLFLWRNISQTAFSLEEQPEELPGVRVTDRIISGSTMICVVGEKKNSYSFSCASQTNFRSGLLPEADEVAQIFYYGGYLVALSINEHQHSPGLHLSSRSNYSPSRRMKTSFRLSIFI